VNILKVSKPNGPDTETVFYWFSKNMIFQM